MVLNVVLSVERLTQAMKLPDTMKIIRVDQDFNDTMNNVVRVAVAFDGQVVPGGTLKTDEFTGIEIGPHLEKYVKDNAPKKVEAEPNLKLADEIVDAASTSVKKAKKK
jgi:hypothetical protein